jgi:8-oxo-dGTP diphosphatase
MEKKFVRVGAGVIVLNDKGQFIMGKRKGSHGSGKWHIPGGHLEFKETLEECAKREVFEETGLIIDNIKPLSFGNHIFEKDDKHYISIYLIGMITGGQLELREPHKCKEWQWFDNWNNLPKPLFCPYDKDVKTEYIKEYLESIKLLFK